MTEYYELVRRTIETRPGQLLTAAVWSCALCDVTISGMGGPGDGDLCVRCGDLIRSGNVRLTEHTS